MLHSKHWKSEIEVRNWIGGRIGLCKDNFEERHLYVEYRGKGGKEICRSTEIEIEK